MFKKFIIFLTLWAAPLLAEEKTFTLQTPEALVETGFLKFLLPRFSLKTGIRVSLSAAQGDTAFGATGTPVFRDADTVWHLEETDNVWGVRFKDWLLSDVGKRTIEGFKRDGAAAFSADVAPVALAAPREINGDARLGEEVSLKSCGRCHVVSEKNRMSAIGSTPSFALMRNFEDWEDRFRAFFALKPHGAFTQVVDVTEPFAENLPSPIAPITVTLDEIEAIVAYVAALAPADLGAPIQFQ